MNAPESGFVVLKDSLVTVLRRLSTKFIAIQLKERDLVKYFGDQYREYRQKMPMLIPRPPKQ